MIDSKLNWGAVVTVIFLLVSEDIGAQANCKPEIVKAVKKTAHQDFQTKNSKLIRVDAVRLKIQLATRAELNRLPIAQLDNLLNYLNPKVVSKKDQALIRDAFDALHRNASLVDRSLTTRRDLHISIFKRLAQIFGTKNAEATWAVSRYGYWKLKSPEGTQLYLVFSFEGSVLRGFGLEVSPNFIQGGWQQSLKDLINSLKL